MAKKYVWLKLKDDFFQQRSIKKLRKIAGGDTYTIIYLKLQLLSLKDEGKLFYEGVEDDFIEEMALAIDEDTDNVKVTLMFLEKNGLLEMVSDNEYLLPQVVDSIGTETAAAERMRKMRSTKTQEKLEDKSKERNNVTPMLQPVTEELQEVTQPLQPVTKCYTEKEEEKEREKEKETTTKKDTVNYIDPETSEGEEKSSSSSFSIKQLLEQHGLSNNTILNIMVLIREDNISLERVSEVLKAAQFKHWKEGAIYQALRDNWNTNIEAEQAEKEKQREKSAKIDEDIKKSSQEFQKTKEKVQQQYHENGRLLNYFATLNIETQEKIKSLALKRAKEQYPFVYKTMLNTKVIFEVIREYEEGVLNL